MTTKNKKVTALAAEKPTVETSTAVSTVIHESALTGASLAQYANYDLTQFKDVALDMVEQSGVFKNDILIPKVWLIQEMSELRKEGKAKAGEFVDSQSEEVLPLINGKLRFVVLKMFKRWHTFEIKTEKGKVKKEFISSEIMVFGKNHDLKYKETIEGKEIVRRQVISAYVLLERDFAAGINKPYVIDFASSSKHGGRILASDINTLNGANLPSFVAFFEMESKEESFDENTAFVKSIKFGGYLSKDKMPFLLDCHKSIISIEDQIELDDRDVIKGEGEASDTPETNVNKKAGVANAKI